MYLNKITMYYITLIKYKSQYIGLYYQINLHPKSSVLGLFKPCRDFLFLRPVCPVWFCSFSQFGTATSTLPPILLQLHWATSQSGPQWPAVGPGSLGCGSASCPPIGSGGPVWPLWPPRHQRRSYHPPPACHWPSPPCPALQARTLCHKGRWRSHRSNQSPPQLKY